MSYTKEIVLDYFDSEFDRAVNSACEYCGITTSLTRDHVIPVSYTSETRTYAVGDTIRCCSECNYALGNKAIFNVESRAEYLINAYQYKYRKVLSQERWSEIELDDMSEEFKRSIRASEDLRKIVTKRLSNLSYTAFGDSVSCLKVKQQSSDDVSVSKAVCMLLRGVKEESVADELGLPVSTIWGYCRLNKYIKPRTSVLYDFGMPLDLNIMKYNRNLIKDISIQV